jgi:hypothetical protein
VLVKVAVFRASKAPWAMVPLNPNELSRELFDAVVRGSTSAGIWNGLDDTIDDRCAFSLRKNISDNVCEMQGTYPRSCALTATTEAISGPTTSEARPAAAAAGSKWPTFDFSDVHWIATLP